MTAVPLVGSGGTWQQGGQWPAEPWHWEGMSRMGLRKCQLPCVTGRHHLETSRSHWDRKVQGSEEGARVYEDMLPSTVAFHPELHSLTQLFSKDWSMFWSYPSAMQTHKSNQDLLAWMHAQSCPTLHDPTDCSLPGYSNRGVFQARILEWVAISCSRGSSPPGIEPLSFCISCTGRWVL